MRKKIMIAVDQSFHARNAIQYAIQMAEVIKKVDFTLYHIQPMISQYLVEEALKQPKARAELEEVNRKNKKASQQLLEDCKSNMVSKGIEAGCIEMNSQPRDQGIAQDILKAAETGSYDAIIVGRRGISGLQELFMGSVTSNLLAGSNLIPIWVVDGVVKKQKVLVPVDGSTQSLRIVDHVAYIFSENRDVQLHFLNIEPRLGDYCEIDMEASQTMEIEKALLIANEKCIADFSAKAVGILKKAGFGKDQISFQTLKKQLFTAKAILETSKKEGFGTVVIGKTGADKSRQLGKVASQIIQKMSNGAVWVVP